jgi:signal recognition particle receptor subunit beta
MAFTNLETKEINCKIVYFGAKGSGKTANLRSIFSRTSPQTKTGLFELTGDDNPLFYEFLPLSIGTVGDFHIKVHLYTLPNHDLYESVYSILLRGLDGFVFVGSCQFDQVADTVKEQARIKELLIREGYNLGDLPCVMQYNKADLMPEGKLDVLADELNTLGAETCKAVASQNIGTMETLELVTRKVLEQLTRGELRS